MLPLRSLLLRSVWHSGGDGEAGRTFQPSRQLRAERRLVYSSAASTHHFSVAPPKNCRKRGICSWDLQEHSLDKNVLEANPGGLPTETAAGSDSKNQNSAFSSSLLSSDLHAATTSLVLLPTRRDAPIRRHLCVGSRAILLHRSLQFAGSSGVSQAPGRTEGLAAIRKFAIHSNADLIKLCSVPLQILTFDRVQPHI